MIGEWKLYRKRNPRPWKIGGLRKPEDLRGPFIIPARSLLTSVKRGGPLIKGSRDSVTADNFSQPWTFGSFCFKTKWIGRLSMIIWFGLLTHKLSRRYEFNIIFHCLLLQHYQQQHQLSQLLVSYSNGTNEEIKLSEYLNPKLLHSIFQFRIYSSSRIDFRIFEIRLSFNSTNQ